MRVPDANSKESTLNLRIDSSLKEEFSAAVKAEGRPSAEVIRALMHRYVQEVRRRRFAAEARRQLSTHRILKG